MEKTRQMYMKEILLYGMIFTAWVFWAVFGPQAAHAVSRFFHWSLGEDVQYGATSVQYRYPQEFLKTCRKYKGFSGLYCEDASIPIPGLAFTELGERVCSQMVPQGICIAGDYMLISAYDNGANASLPRNKSYCPMNSVIYILSYQEGCPGEFLTTLELPDVNHVGGLAFDGRRIWVAKSSTRALSAISYEWVEAAAQSGRSSVFLPEYDATLSCGTTASFVSFHDQRLWVGTYSSVFSGPGSLTTFSVLEEEGLALQREDTWEIPSCAQGIAFFEEEGNTYMALSTSCGRFVNSSLHLYQLSGENRNVLFLKGSLCLPPMSEELVSDGTHTYVLFESGATCYSGGAGLKCPYPVDRVCGLDSGRLLAEIGGK